jgi:hypothetical protein
MPTTLLVVDRESHSGPGLARKETGISSIRMGITKYKTSNMRTVARSRFTTVLAGVPPIYLVRVFRTLPILEG